MTLKHQSVPQVRETESQEFLTNNLKQSSDPFIQFQLIQGLDSELESVRFFLLFVLKPDLEIPKQN